MEMAKEETEAVEVEVEGKQRTRVQLTVWTDAWERRLIARHLDGSVLWDEEAAREADEAEIREFFRRFGVDVGWQVIEKRRELHPELAPPLAGEALGDEAEIVSLLAVGDVGDEALSLPA